jgi:hypothetical protein
VRATRQELDRLDELAHTMQRQLGEGIHQNPLLAIWPNPPGSIRISFDGRLSTRVYLVQYKHSEDGQDYEHAFAPGIAMLRVILNGGAHAILMVSEKGEDIWQDFE